MTAMPVSAPDIDTTATASRVARGRFPDRFEHIEITEPARGRRIEITDPEGEGHWVLGPAEFAVARVFDGQSTLDDLAARLAASGVRADAAKLARFEDRLLALGVLEADGQTSRSRDPFTGFHFSVLHHLVIQRLGTVRPEPVLDRLLAWPLVLRLALLALASAAALAVPVLLVAMGGRFLDVTLATLTGWTLPALYLTTLASGFLHEGGHALACRAMGVRVRETGFAIYFLMPFAWTRPDRRDWEALPMGHRMVAILAGPFASQALAGIGLGLMMVAAQGSTASTIGVVLAVAGLFGAIVTLLPFLNGDGYLLLVEVFRLPNLRRRSFEHLRRVAGLKRGGAGPSPAQTTAMAAGGRGALYLFVAIGTIIGWGALWIGMAWWLSDMVAGLI
ncbi:M50 family metallopeptidase [Tistrella bauzanensis]|uniref:M50 family metallopeptidase n=1 Tax=Tistrella arctica TaxID=3133430 RepID=A0ABU9YID5_9PROT